MVFGEELGKLDDWVVNFAVVGKDGDLLRRKPASFRGS